MTVENKTFSDESVSRGKFRGEQAIDVNIWGLGPNDLWVDPLEWNTIGLALEAYRLQPKQLDSEGKPILAINLYGNGKLQILRELAGKDLSSKEKEILRKQGVLSAVTSLQEVAKVVTVNYVDANDLDDYR